MLSLILVAGFASTLFYYFIIKPYNYWKDRGVKQGKPIWIFGDFFGFQTFAQMVQNIYNQHPNARYSGIYQFFLPTLLIRDPDLIKQITVKDFDHFTDHKGVVTAETDPLWRKNLFSLTGQKWREMRPILSPTFTSSKMRAIFVLMVECAENFVQHFLQKGEDIITSEMKDVFTRYTNDVIATTAFGVQVDSLGEPNNQFYLTGKEATNISGLWQNLKFILNILAPKIHKVLKLKMFSQRVSVFFRNLVDETIKIREEKGIVRPDLINSLLEARKGMEKYAENNLPNDEELTTVTKETSQQLTNEDITAQALVFFLGGFDTSSSLMSFAAYELTVHPDIQEKLRREIRTTLETCGGKLTYEALLNMKYMDMVISETLRKWPIGTILDRVCTKPYTIDATTPEETPLHLDKGTVLWIPAYAIHHNPEYFPNPERFDPERFNDENKEDIKPYTYMPFGIGPRNCIGSRFALLETKAVLFYILLHFQFIPIEKTQIPLRISKKSFNTTTEKGVWIGLKRI